MAPTLKKFPNTATMSQAEEEEKLVTNVDEREEEMVPFTGGRPTVRLARFLKPCLEEVAQVPTLPKTKGCNVTKCPIAVDFRGWRCGPNKDWKQWVDRLRPKHGATWKKIGIYDSIVGSTYEFPKEKELVLGLADSWCPETNTFVFSWGEATLTLEDMLILGGLSVLGEPFNSLPLTDDLVEIEKEMIQEYRELVKSKAHKVEHCPWINRFMGVANHLEHAAFITLWLSRYVLPTKSGVDKMLFSTAIHLSQGTPIALAPVVLAGLYRDLRVLKEQMDASYPGSNSSFIVWAPFQILQLWACERFLRFQQTPTALLPNEPRAARWNKLKLKLKIDLVMRSINLPDDFQWRPYSSTLENWRHPLYEKEYGQWVVVNSKMKQEVLTFLRCYTPCKLVGLECSEQYAPYRVGMQFGIDQDIPGDFTQVEAKWEIAWRTYDKPIRSISFYIPSRLFESDVTRRYFDWWKQSTPTKQAEKKNISVQQISSSSSSESESWGSPPGFSCRQWSKDKSPDDEDKMTIFQWQKQRKDHAPISGAPASSSKYLSSAQVQTSPSITKEKATRNEQATNVTDKNLQGKAPMENGDILEEDKELQNNDSDEYLLDLEMRATKLENVVNWLKEKRRHAAGNTSHVQ